MFGAVHHKQVVELSASIWCPIENRHRSPTAEDAKTAEGSKDDALEMGTGFVNPLTPSELAELKALLGRATPLSIVETRRVQTLMKQTQRIGGINQDEDRRRFSPDPVDPAPKASFSPRSGGSGAKEVHAPNAGSDLDVSRPSAKELVLERLSDEDLRQKCLDCVARVDNREELLKLASLLLEF
jgi:hypothetical protein